MNTKKRPFSDYSQSLILLVFVNLVLSILKLLFGYWSHSSSLRSNGFNNTADLAYTALFSVGLWISLQPADSSHPEGHGRFESLIGMVVSLVIFGTGSFVLWDAYLSFLNPIPIKITTPAIILVLSSIVMKGGTGWYLIKEGNRLASSPLKAIGRDQTGDMLADGAVLAAFLGTFYEIWWLDPIVATAIGFSIIYISWEPFSQNLKYLTGRSPDGRLDTDIEAILENFDVFNELSSLKAHYVGPNVHVSITVKAPGNLTLERLHESEEKLRTKILELTEVSRVFIHVEPPEANSPI